MKINRYKKVTRRIAFYVNNYSFRSPYQLLIDGTFCFAALNNKINIQDNMPRYLQAELKFITTQCILIEIEKLGPPVFGALQVLKKFGLHKCGHEGKPIPGSKCIMSMTKNCNEKHYIVATQDKDLQDKLRVMPGIPLLFLHNKAPVLDDPSEASEKHAKNLMDQKFGVRSIETNVKKQLDEMNSKKIKTKKKKKKNPNPLSCLKKKKKPGAPAEKIQHNKITKTEVDKTRRKVRIPQHVKEELMKRKNECSGAD